MSVQSALKNLVEGCVEEGLNWRQTQAMLPSLIISHGQRNPSDGLLALPMPELIGLARAEFVGVSPAEGRSDSTHPLASSVSRFDDDDTPIKKALNWNQYQIGLQYEALDDRHGRILPLGYGEFLGMVSEHDGMNADVYVGNDLRSDRVFAISQLDYETGEFDEVKFIIGVDKPIDDVAKLYQAIMTPEHFGGIEEIDKDAIASYKPRPLLKTGRLDATPIQVDGELLPDKEWDEIADVSPADAEAALKDWQDSAPEQFAEILESDVESP